MDRLNYNLISFPRSGQHLTERLLQKVCDYFHQPYSYCEFYECCQKVPCKKKARFMKNHDFDLKYNIIPNEKYIVLYRSDYIHQFESYFRIMYPSIKNFNYLENPLLYKKLIEFIIKKIPYRNSFINKWVNNNNENILKINYDDIIKSSDIYLKSLLTFMQIKYEETDISNILSSFEEIKYLNRLPESLIHKIIEDVEVFDKLEREKLIDKNKKTKSIAVPLKKIKRKWNLF